MPTLSERIPPQNIEAEQSLLGALLIDRDAIIKIADAVTAEDFYKDAHRAIFEAMTHLFQEREPIDLLSLGNRLEEKKQLEAVGGRTYLIELSNIVPTSANVIHYGNIVQKKATLRRLQRAAAEITNLSFEEAEEVDHILDKSEQKLFSVSQKYLKQTFVPIREVLTEAFDRIDELHREKGKLRGLSTGFFELDNILAGLQKSDLIVLASRPSVGKTSLALDIARQVAGRQKVPVGIFSLEMSKEQLVDRLICAEAGVDLWRMRTGRLSDKPEHDDFPRIGQALGMLSEAPLFIDDSATNNIMEIRAKARRLQMEKGLGLLIVDYLQLMESRTRIENRVQEVSEITRSLKAIARELNIPVLALSQLSRAVEARSPAIPKLADLRESGCLTGDTLIMRADTGELISIETLARRTHQTPFPVYSIDKQWKIVIKTITRVFPSGKKKIYEIKLRSGRTIRASLNHPFLKLGGWTRLETLQAGDRIALPRALAPITTANAMTNDELIFLAHILGDGCTVPSQPIHYTSSDRENLEIVARIAQKRFGIAPRYVRQKNWWHLYLPCPYRLGRGKHNPIVSWFTELGIGLRRSYEKIIPQAVFCCDLDSVALFLHHLWATDGNISWKCLARRKPAAAIYYSTTSPVLAKQVQHLLLRLGILSTLKAVSQGAHRPNYQIHIQGSEMQQKFLGDVGCSGRRGTLIPKIIDALRAIKPNPNIDTIPKEAWHTIIKDAKDARGWGWRELSAAIDTAYCGTTLFKAALGRERALRVAIAVKSHPLQALAHSDVFWDEIISITPNGIEHVFDATVPGTHNFIANDIIVHNSIEQDSDVVLFIYRKSMDKGAQNLSTEERNLADIYISKHRNGPTGQIQLYFDEQKVSFRNLEKTNQPF